VAQWHSAGVAHGLAQLDRREHASGAGASTRNGAARTHGGATRVCCSGDLTGTREAAAENTAGSHRRVDGGTVELVGVDGSAWAARRGVDGGTRAARRFGGDLRGTMLERSARPKRRENAAARRTHRRVGWGRRWRRRGRWHGQPG
jgi:hypothetical protein